MWKFEFVAGGICPFMTGLVRSDVSTMLTNGTIVFVMMSFWPLVTKLYWEHVISLTTFLSG